MLLRVVQRQGIVGVIAQFLELDFQRCLRRHFVGLHRIDLKCVDLWFISAKWMRCVAARQSVQRQLLAPVAPSLGTGTERHSAPRRVLFRGNVLRPARKRVHGVRRQAHQLGLRWALLGHGSVEGLLHRPSGIAKLGQADHARAAFERVEGAPQRGQAFQIAQILAQRCQCGQAVAHHLTGFFQEDVEQFATVVFVFGQQHGLRNDHLGWRHHLGRRRSRGRWCYLRRQPYLRR